MGLINCFLTRMTMKSLSGQILSQGPMHLFPFPTCRSHQPFSFLPAVPSSCRCICGRRSDILCPEQWHALGMPTLLFKFTNKSVSHYLSILNGLHFSSINGNKCINLCIDGLNITRCIKWINFLARVNFSWIFFKKPN